MSARELKEIYHNTKVTLLEDEQVQEGKIVKPMLIGGVATQGNVLNQNGRYYKTELWKRECERKQDVIKAGKLLGELDHPDDGKSRLAKTAVRYTKLEMNDDYMNFEAEVLGTTNGLELKELLRGKVGVDMSTRGFGNTKKETVDGVERETVLDDFDLVAIDPVAGHSNLAAEIQYYQENKKGGNDMDLEQLKKEQPDLFAAIVKDTEVRVTKEMTDKLTKDFEEKILDEIAKSRDEIVAEVTKEVKENLVPEYEEHQNMLGEIAEIVKDFVGEGNESGDKGEKDEQVTKLEQELETSKSTVSKMREDLDDARGKIAANDVKEYLDEALKNEPFKNVLKERLSKCKSKEEVDKQLETEKEWVNKVVQEDKNPAGTGETIDKDKEDKKLEEQQDSSKKKQQRLAGVF